MRKQILILILYFIIYLPAITASKDNYHINTIDKSLYKNARCILRKYQNTVQVHSKMKVEQEVKYALTILNEKGDQYSTIFIPYDSFQDIQNIKVTLFDKNGKKIRKIKSSDIYDYSLISGFSIYEDNRMKIIEGLHKNYPYTIEVEYKIKHDGILNYPLFLPQQHNSMAVESAEYTIICPKDFKYRYKCLNHKFNITEKTEIEKQYRTWNIENIPARKQEPYSSSFKEIAPVVYFSPSEFYYDGSYGKIDSWKEFGIWMDHLTKDINSLPQQTINEIKDLTKEITDPKEKTRLIYEYMQNKTRYVSIQLGIGGFQPFEAATTDKMGYGDCKALSFYMQSLLNVAGINSNLTVIGAGKNTPLFLKDFPSINQFNHMILTVPFEKDTVWLECTSQTNPFGYIAGFTDSRNAICINDEGGHIIKTKSYNRNENLRSRKGFISLNTTGSLQAEIKTHYKGKQFGLISTQENKSEKEQTKWLEKYIPLDDFKIQNFSYTFIKEKNPEVIQQLKFESLNYSNIVNNNVYVNLNLLSQIKHIPKNINNRKNIVVINDGYTFTDSLFYNIPEDLTISKIPKEINLSTKYGQIQVKYNYNESLNRLVYYRKLELFKGKFPSDEYNELRKFYKDIRNIDSKKIVLKKKS